MFSFQHIIRLSISALGIAIASRLLLARPAPIERVLTAACVPAAIPETIEILSNIQTVPSADGASLRLFMEWRRLPFRLCSIQTFLIFAFRTPINPAPTEIWQWYAHVELLAMLPFAVIGASCLPFRKKRRGCAGGRAYRSRISSQHHILRVDLFVPTSYCGSCNHASPRIFGDGQT